MIKQLFLLPLFIQFLVFIQGKPLKTCHALDLGSRYRVDQCATTDHKSTLLIFAYDRKLEKSRLIKRYLHRETETGDFQYFNELTQLSNTEIHLSVPLGVYRYSEINYFVYEHRDDSLWGRNRLMRLSGKSWSLSDLQTLASNILTALMNLHKKGLVHGKVTPESIEVRDNMYYLGDFEILTKLTSQSAFRRLQKADMCYRPPEFVYDRQISTKFDIWSFGTVLMRLGPESGWCAGPGIAEVSGYQSMMYDFDQRTKEGSYIRKEMKKLRKIQDWEVDKYDQFIDLVENMLLKDPSKRLGAQEALKHPFLTEKLPLKQKRGGFFSKLKAKKEN